MLMKLNPLYKIILPLYNLYINIYILNIFKLQIYMIAFYEIKNGCKNWTNTLTLLVRI